MQGQPDLSLSILLQLRTPDVFAFIEQHSLVGELRGDRAATLLGIDEAAALRLLTRNAETLLPAAVVPSIQVRWKWDRRREGRQCPVVSFV